jgi:DNA-binding MarR family transcriptional regulator
MSARNEARQDRMANDQDTVVLELLQDIEQNRFESQRQFASKLDIAVGLANSYIKRCIRKGWIKMSRAPARRYAYYLTPKGFSEKGRLTAQYLGASLRLYRQARKEYLEAFQACQKRGWSKLGLYGTGDLAEVAALSARESGHRGLIVIEPANPGSEFLGISATRRLDAVGSLDAVLVTSIEAPQQAFDVLSRYLPSERIVTIPLLGVRQDVPLPDPEAGTEAQARSDPPFGAEQEA